MSASQFNPSATRKAEQKLPMASHSVITHGIAIRSAQCQRRGNRQRSKGSGHKKGPTTEMAGLVLVKGCSRSRRVARRSLTGITSIICITGLNQFCPDAPSFIHRVLEDVPAIF